MLIRLNGDRGPVFINPETVGSIYRSGEKDAETTVIRTTGERPMSYMVSGLPDDVHAALFPSQDEEKATT